MIVAVDPGLTGALAAVTTTGDLVSVIDMPVIDKCVNAAIVTDWLAEHDPTVVVVEKVGAMPGQGVSSMFRFGQAYGTVLGAAGARWRVAHASPATWKRGMGLTSDKDRSRRMAAERWPDHAGLFLRAKDDGRAEAALLAVWWLAEHGEVAA